MIHNHSGFSPEIFDAGCDEERSPGRRPPMHSLQLSMLAATGRFEKESFTAQVPASQKKIRLQRGGFVEVHVSVRKTTSFFDLAPLLLQTNFVFFFVAGDLMVCEVCGAMVFTDPFVC